MGRQKNETWQRKDIFVIKSTSNVKYTRFQGIIFPALATKLLCGFKLKKKIVKTYNIIRHCLCSVRQRRKVLYILVLVLCVYIINYPFFYPYLHFLLNVHMIFLNTLWCHKKVLYDAFASNYVVLESRQFCIDVTG